MNSFPLAFRTNFRRFAWEIALFWLLLLVLIPACAAGGFEARRALRPVFPASLLEVAAAGWLTLRLMMAESHLRTQGGWRTRPLSRGAVRLAPFAVLAVALLPALLLRALAMQLTLHPDPGQWRDILWFQWLPAIGGAIAAVLALKAIASLFGPAPRSARRKLACGAVLVALLVAWFHPYGLTRLLRPLSIQEGSFYGRQNLGGAVLGIRELVPRRSAELGDWGAWSQPVPRQREAFRLPLTSGAVVRRPGIAGKISRQERVERQLQVEIELQVADARLAFQLTGATPVLRYAGDRYALPDYSMSGRTTPALLLAPRHGVTLGGIFPTPLDERDPQGSWEEMLAGAELIVFLADPSQPPIVTPPPTLPAQAKPSPPAVATLPLAAFLDALDFDFSDWQRRRDLERQGPALPATALPEILARRPWSDAVWTHCARPLLLAHAGEAEKAILLERFATDPRLGEVLVAKGWTADALPGLRRFAHDRLPLDVLSLKTLLEQRDPALAADLAALAARLDEGVASLEPLLRAQPGLDWPGFVHDGWRRCKYSYRTQPDFPTFARWAAQLGDESALRHLGERAARGEKESQGQLAQLLAAGTEEPVAYLRERLGRLSFDPATGKWAGH